MGTAYLLCPEARISIYHRAALRSARDNLSAITNVLTGRPARVFMNRIVRELGPLATGVPSFAWPGLRSRRCERKRNLKAPPTSARSMRDKPPHWAGSSPQASLPEACREARERLGMLGRAS